MAIRSRRLSARGETSRSDRSTVTFDVPPGASDCHVHVICAPDQFPFAPDRPYTPPPAPADALTDMLDQLHMERVVIVSPAIYGASNDCTLDAIRQLGSRARGIALLAPQTTHAECERLRRAGIQGLRLNFETLGVTDPRVAIKHFGWASKLAAEHGWHVQINTRLAIVAALAESIAKTHIQVVFDHFAQAQPSLGVAQPGFSALAGLLKADRAYVKISAAYRISKHPPPYPDVAPLARALIAANPKRILWGSDWPHPDTAQMPGRGPTDLRPPLPVDDAEMLNQLSAWVPDPVIRRAILVENPARLYGFPANVI
jgi:predicted TIM-barrel fold metal-dependent hydrolase